VQFDKPTPSRPQARLSGFGLVVQAHAGPTREEVEAKSPPVMREDLLAVVEAFEHGVSAGAVMLRRCTQCDEPVAEFYVVRGDTYCAACKEALDAG
jgi:hypothetical protein